MNALSHVNALSIVARLARFLKGVRGDALRAPAVLCFYREMRH